MKVRVLDAAFTGIEDHARAAYPEECCGLMIGSIPESFGAPDAALDVAEIRKLDNAWESAGKTRRYQMDPGTLAAVEKELGGTGRGVLGFYHSHPDVAAWPSPFDLDRAWPAYAYVIVSVKKGEIADARVWRLSEDARSFEEGSLKKLRETCFEKTEAS